MHTELESIKSRYDHLKNYFFNEKGKRDQLREQESGLKSSIRIMEENIDLYEKSRLLFKKVSEYAREKSRSQIESLVTNCLQYIFDSNIEFGIEINEVRGRPEAEFYVMGSVDGETFKTRPQEARGGGVVDILSLALRIAMLEYGSPEINGPIILDEPAKHVSDEYITQVAEFLKQVSEMFDRQIIMVTHNRHLSEIANKSFRIEMSDGVSRAVFDS